MDFVTFRYSQTSCFSHFQSEMVVGFGPFENFRELKSHFQILRCRPGEFLHSTFLQHRQIKTSHWQYHHSLFDPCVIDADLFLSCLQPLLVCFPPQLLFFFLVATPFLVTGEKIKSLKWECEGKKRKPVDL